VPEFANTTYSADIPETAPPGFVVCLCISCSDVTMWKSTDKRVSVWLYLPPLIGTVQPPTSVLKEPLYSTDDIG